MSVDITTLIKTAPFTKEQKQGLLSRLDKLTDNQKHQIITTSWVALSQMYFAKLNYEYQKLLIAVREGKKKYNKKDFELIKEKVTQEFAKKLESAETQESVEKVRQELQKHLKK